MYALRLLGVVALAFVFAAAGWALATDFKGLRTSGNAFNARMLGRVPPWSRLPQRDLMRQQDWPARLFGWALFGMGVLLAAAVGAELLSNI